MIRTGQIVVANLAEKASRPVAVPAAALALPEHLRQRHAPMILGRTTGRGVELPGFWKVSSDSAAALVQSTKLGAGFPRVVAATGS